MVRCMPKAVPVVELQIRMEPVWPEASVLWAEQSEISSFKGETAEQERTAKPPVGEEKAPCLPQQAPTEG